MTQVVLNINSKKQWNALKTILEVMNIDYTTHEAKMSEGELELLHRAENDIATGKINSYTNHRDILGR